VAAALETHGMQLQMAHDMKGAVATLEDAQVAALASRDTAVETLAWIELALVMGYDYKVADGTRAAREAHACLERDGGNDERLSLLLLGESRLAWVGGRYSDAVALGERSLQLRERILPADHPDIAAALNTLGIAAMDSGNLDASLAYHRRAVSIRQAAFGPMHPLVSASKNNLAIVQWARGDLDDAIGNYREAYEIGVAALGPEDRGAAYALEGLGLALSDRGDQEGALDVLQHALDILTHAVGPDHHDAAVAHSNLAEPLLRLGRWDEAIANATRLLDSEQRANGPEAPGLSLPLVLIGRGLAGKHQYAQATQTLERAVRLAEAPGYSPRKLARARMHLARVLRDSHGDGARAASLAAQARAEFERQGARLELERVDAEFPAAR
jgi:tetratricopeptide (TPR) repeat protein